MNPDYETTRYIVLVILLSILLYLKKKMPTLPKREKPKAKPFATTQNPFYNSRAWRQFSLAYRKANPLCVECYKKGKIVPVQVVDHINPIRRGGDPFDYNNCQSLCHQCHNSKSGHDGAEKAVIDNFEKR
jgi:5-methylcytosine-specific restriction endonuclease McrA